MLTKSSEMMLTGIIVISLFAAGQCLNNITIQDSRSDVNGRVHTVENLHQEASDLQRRIDGVETDLSNPHNDMPELGKLKSEKEYLGPLTVGEDPLAMLRITIPGLPGLDYPIFGNIPSTEFLCSQQNYPGLYADVLTQCQVFHICSQNGRQDSFLCPNGTMFNQQYFVCDWWYNVQCTQSPIFYRLNSNFYGTNSDEENPQINGSEDKIDNVPLGGIQETVGDHVQPPQNVGLDPTGNHPTPSLPTHEDIKEEKPIILLGDVSTKDQHTTVHSHLQNSPTEATSLHESDVLLRTREQTPLVFQVPTIQEGFQSQSEAQHASTVGLAHDSHERFKDSQVVSLTEPVEANGAFHSVSGIPGEGENTMQSENTQPKTVATASPHAEITYGNTEIPHEVHQPNFEKERTSTELTEREDKLNTPPSSQEPISRLRWNGQQGFRPLRNGIYFSPSKLSELKLTTEGVSVNGPHDTSGSPFFESVGSFQSTTEKVGDVITRSGKPRLNQGIITSQAETYQQSSHAAGGLRRPPGLYPRHQQKVSIQFRSIAK